MATWLAGRTCKLCVGAVRRGAAWNDQVRRGTIDLGAMMGMIQGMVNQGAGWAGATHHVGVAQL